MNAKSVFIFPAVITKFDENDYNVRFPDFPEIITYGETIEEAYEMAEDALKLCLFELYEEELEQPNATAIGNIKTTDQQTIILIKADMNKIIKEYDDKAVKKTLTIPSWLNKEAEKSHINFSQVLQEALRTKLGLND